MTNTLVGELHTDYSNLHSLTVQRRPVHPVISHPFPHAWTFQHIVRYNLLSIRYFLEPSSLFLSMYIHVRLKEKIFFFKYRSPYLRHILAGLVDLLFCVQSAVESFSYINSKPAAYPLSATLISFKDQTKGALIVTSTNANPDTPGLMCAGAALGIRGATRAPKVTGPCTSI